MVFVEDRRFSAVGDSEKEDVFGDLTTIARITKLAKRKAGSVKQNGGL